MASKGRTILFVSIVLLIVFLGTMGAGALALYFLMSDDSPEVEQGSVLLVDLRGTIGELSQASIRDEFFGRRPVNLTEAVHLLRHAANDARIDKLVLRLGGTAGIGWGSGSEIRDALLAFRESGKPVDAYIEVATDLSYYMGSASGRILLSPGGMLAVDGLYAEVQFLKNLFSKIDVSFEAVTAGEYKSYPEAYLNDRMSDQFRMQIDRLLDARFDEYVEAIALGRQLLPIEVIEAIDRGPYLVPQAAIEAGLVDTLLFWSDYERGQGIGEEGDVPAITLAEYRDAGVLPGPSAQNTVAVVFVVGDILPGKSRDGIGAQVAGSESIVGDIDRAAEDDEIDAIILRVSSPGGSVLASDAIWRAVERARERIPVVISMGDVAASGGYWISAGADEILADPNTITGSIGVFALRPVWNELLDRVGIGVEEFSRGENAAIFYSGKPWSEGHRRVLEAGIQHSYDEFLERVATGRGMAIDQVLEIAGGQTWSGRAALENGLVDRLGGIAEAVDVAKEHAGISLGTDVALRFYPEEKSLLDRVRDGDINIRALVREEARAMLDESGITLPGILPYTVEDGGSLWALLPFRMSE